MEKEKEKVMMAPAPVPRIVIKHSVLGSRAMNQYVSCVFSIFRRRKEY
jgi:hypothetical protein